MQRNTFCEHCVVFHTPWQYDKKPVNFGQGLDFLKVFGQILGSRHAQVAICTVFHEESESDVEKIKKLEPGGKI